MPPKKRSKTSQSRSDEAMTKTYLEFLDGSSHKFWQIEVNDESTIVQYGKIGTKGSTSEKKHKNSDAAHAFAKKQKNEKLKKGYDVCVKEDDVPPKKRSKTSREKTSDTTDAKLIRSDDDIKQAVNEWCEDSKKATRKYGHISDWDTSRVTDMKELFWYQRNFNDDISRWNVSNVTIMDSMFTVSYTHLTLPTILLV